MLVPKLAFGGDFIIVLKRISARSLKNTVKLSKHSIWISKATMFDNNVFEQNMFFREGVPASFVAKESDKLI